MAGDAVEIIRSECDADGDGMLLGVTYRAAHTIRNTCYIVKFAVRLDKTDEEVLFIAKAIDFLEYCPMCEMAIYEDTVVIGMENARLIPFYCCNLMAWFMETDPKEEE